jgi:transcriptional antiterminator RfaH
MKADRISRIDSINAVGKGEPISECTPVDLIDRINPFNQEDPVESINQTGPIDLINLVDPINQTGCRRWYVLYTKPRSEDLAQDQLEEKDISVFLPKIRELRESIQPMFRNYIFARFSIPEEYYDVKWARGVKRIVGSGDTPIPLDDSIVIFLKEQVNEDGLVQQQPSLKDGDKVRVKQGPLEGLWGIVHGGIDSKHRVKVLMDILHSGAKVELPYSFVEKY